MADDQMPATPIAKKYAWVQDRFGISWQLIVS